MKEATAARVIPFTGTRRKDTREPGHEKGTGGTGEYRPSRAISLELIDRFDENRMHLDAFLDGIYNSALSGATMEDCANSIMVFCSMAKDRVKEMDKVFKEITGEGGETDND